MKISYNWLKEFVKTDLTVDQAAVMLTAGGLEVENVESFESVKGGLKGLFVGQVLTCAKRCAECCGRTKSNCCSCWNYCSSGYR